MDKQLAMAFKNRWKAVEAFEIEERRVATMELRWRQLNAIYELGHSLGLLDIYEDRGEEEVRLRWSKLKENLP